MIRSVSADEYPRATPLGPWLRPNTIPTITSGVVAALIGGAAIALLGPTSQEAALTRLQAQPWLAVPAGVALAYLLLLVGGRLPNVFIYFQF